MKSRPEPPSFSALRLAGLGIQMVVIIALFAWGGVELDRRMQTQKPWFTLGLSIAGSVIALVYMIATFLKNTRK